MAVKAAVQGNRCELQCFDRDKEPRFCPPGSEYTICPTCRANMADWSSRQLIEAKFYEDQLDLRKRRMHEVTHATKESYIGVLKAKRRRWAAHARA